MCNRYTLLSVAMHNLKLQVFKVTSFGLIHIITHFFSLKPFNGHLLLQIGMGSQPLQNA